MTESFKAMEDEKIETKPPGLEGNAAGQDLTRQVLWKLDIR
jgi:hypothetical protein